MSKTTQDNTQDSIQEPTKYATTLIYSAFVAGLCSIVYELLIATTVSYFLGNSVQYFSITIGIYMAAMGVGSWLSKFIQTDLLRKFLLVEVLLAMVGGFSIPLLYMSYATDALFFPTYIILTFLVGLLIGLEIPFLTRLMESYQSLKFNIANILSFDYAGALVATLAFPFFLLPTFGNYLSSLILGLINLSIVAVALGVYRRQLQGSTKLVVAWFVIALVGLTFAVVYSAETVSKWEQSLYSGRIVYSEQTAYQKIVMTKFRDDVRLYLDGNIQFSSVDEYRYHEALVQYPLTQLPSVPKRVLVLGAGDGVAVRELLKFDSIEQIILVDLDEKVVELATSNHFLLDINHNSLANAKVQVKIADAFTFLKGNQQPFDLIISDLPDPNTISLARLYSKQFFHLVSQNLDPEGIFVTQATSPYYAQKAYWSIVETIKAAGFNAIVPYHLNIPSFGQWGFVMASLGERTYKVLREPVQTQFLSLDNMHVMTVFAKDLIYSDAKVNSIDKPVLLDYYLEGWQNYAH